MHDGLRSVGLKSFFERLDRQVKSSAALEAPAEREANVDVLRLDLGRFAKQWDGVEEGFHRPQRLTAKEEHVGLHAARILDAVERLEDAAGKLVASVRSARHLIAKYGDQIEIALGLSKDLLPANATG